MKAASSCAVSHVHGGCKHESSSLGVVDETAGAGADRPRAPHAAADQRLVIPAHQKRGRRARSWLLSARLGHLAIVEDAAGFVLVARRPCRG
jgi:hypothetical protein